MKNFKPTPSASLLFATLILTLFAFAGSGCSKKEAQGKVLATYDGGAVTEAEFSKAIRNMPDHIRVVAQGKKAEFLDSFVTERLLLQEAEAKGVQHLADAQDLIRQSRDRILVTKLIEQEIDKKIDITDADIKSYYDSHSDEFTIPYRLRAAHILVRERSEADSLISRIKAGESFEELAKKHSMDPTSAKGGDLGYVRKGQLIPEVEEALFGLKVGDLSGVIASKFGFHILKVTGEAKPQIKELELVGKDIRDRLMLEKRSQAFNILIDRLKQKAGIKMNTEELEKLDFTVEQPAA